MSKIPQAEKIGPLKNWISKIEKWRFSHFGHRDSPIWEDWPPKIEDFSSFAKREIYHDLQRACIIVISLFFLKKQQKNESAPTLSGFFHLKGSNPRLSTRVYEIPPNQPLWSLPSRETPESQKSEKWKKKWLFCVFSISTTILRALRSKMAQFWTHFWPFSV